MIVKLNESHHQVVWNFLVKEPSLNLFQLGDIEAFGYEEEFQELWGDFRENGELRAVLLRFYDSFIPYAESTDFDVLGFAEKMKQHPSITLSGVSKIVHLFEDIEGLTLGEKREMYFCEQQEEAGYAGQDMQVFLATKADIPSICHLRRQIEDFVVPDDAEERLEKALNTQTGRVYGYRVEGQVVASAGTAAENSASAMIVAVCTDPNHRQKGYASRVLERLVHDVRAQGKTLCLFYDNPDAGRIYKRLGFRDIGKWTMYR